MGSLEFQIMPFVNEPESSCFAHHFNAFDGNIQFQSCKNIYLDIVRCADSKTTKIIHWNCKNIHKNSYECNRRTDQNNRLHFEIFEYFPCGTKKDI